jgi:ATP-dependent DNA ligase
MSRRPVAKSKKQYTKGLNNPAVAVVRDHPHLRHGSSPGFVAPCLAQARPKPPDRNEWVHEIKFDGYRLQIHIDQGHVHCFTRRGYDWRARFPALATAAWTLDVQSAILDGEAVVVNESGQTDFPALESYVSSKDPDRLRGNLVFYAFDLLYLDAMDLRRLPLSVRKEALRALLPQNSSPLLYSEHLHVRGSEMYRQACTLALEGVVSNASTRHTAQAAAMIGSRSPAGSARPSSSPALRSRAGHSRAFIWRGGKAGSWSTPARLRMGSARPR